MVITSAKRLTSRSQLAGRKRGYDLSAHRARQITLDDYSSADFILAMDWENLSELQRQCPPVFRHKLHLLMRYASEYDAAVIPDPYYGGTNGFNLVLDYCEDACQGLLEIVKRPCIDVCPGSPASEGRSGALVSEVLFFPLI